MYIDKEAITTSPTSSSLFITMTKTKILPALSVLVAILLVLLNLPPDRFGSFLETTTKILGARAKNGTSLGVGNDYLKMFFQWFQV